MWLATLQSRTSLPRVFKTHSEFRDGCEDTTPRNPLRGHTWKWQRTGQNPFIRQLCAAHRTYALTTPVLVNDDCVVPRQRCLASPPRTALSSPPIPRCGWDTYVRLASPVRLYPKGRGCTPEIKLPKSNATNTPHTLRPARTNNCR